MHDSKILKKGMQPLPFLTVGMKIQKTKRSIVWRIDDIIPDGPDYNDMTALLVSNDNICKLYCEKLMSWILAEDYDAEEHIHEKNWIMEKVDES